MIADCAAVAGWCFQQEVGDGEVVALDFGGGG
jgi:hypothetical protein